MKRSGHGRADRTGRRLAVARGHGGAGAVGSPGDRSSRPDDGRTAAHRAGGRTGSGRASCRLRHAAAEDRVQGSPTSTPINRGAAGARDGRERRRRGVGRRRDEPVARGAGRRFRRAPSGSPVPPRRSDRPRRPGPGGGSAPAGRRDRHTADRAGRRRDAPPTRGRRGGCPTRGPRRRTAWRGGGAPRRAPRASRRRIPPRTLRPRTCPPRMPPRPPAGTPAVAGHGGGGFGSSSDRSRGSGDQGSCAASPPARVPRARHTVTSTSDETFCTLPSIIVTPTPAG